MPEPENMMGLNKEALHSLYVALQELETWWANWMPDDANTQGGREALEQARAALTEADGRKR